MGSLKPSVRVRAPSAVVANGNGVHHEPGILTEELKIFQSDRFDADGYVQGRCPNITEKVVRSLCSELHRLKKASAEELRRSVYADYSEFIRASQELSDLEGQVLVAKNLANTQASVIHNLADGIRLDLSPDIKNSEAESTTSNVEHNTHPEEQALSDKLDVLIAERRIDEALDALFEGETLASKLSDKETLHMSLGERRARLRELLVEVARQPSTRGRELRSAISALYKLGDGPSAHTLLLNAHHQKLQNNMQGLRASGTPYGGAYTSALSQLVFSTISQAAKDSQSVFGEQAPYASELVLWASDETSTFASLVKKHVLSSAAAAGGLRAAAECVQVSLGYCSLLEAQGLALSPSLLKLFRPNVEQALEANLRHIEESIIVLAAADDWIVYHASPSRYGNRTLHISGGLVTHLKLSSSAHRFHSLIQDFFDDVSPLVNLQLGPLMLEGLVRLFETYIEHLIMALPVISDEGVEAQTEHKAVKPAETDHQQLGLFANASALADEILPRAVAKLLPPQQMTIREDSRRRTPDRLDTRVPEMREWRKRWQPMYDKLRTYYCTQQVISIMYTEEGVELFSYYTYVDVDNQGSLLDGLPTHIFQQLFLKLNKLSNVAADVLAGRERVTTILLMRVVDTFLTFISDNPQFWEEMEYGTPLGQAGLQQFVLDMYFVIEIATDGRYLSRTIRSRVNEIIIRAKNTFNLSGQDADSLLPDDKWFVTMARDAISKLESSRGDLGSPTASISAQSISSTRSHGSP